MIDLDRYSRNQIYKNPFLSKQNQLVFVYGKGVKATILFYQKEPKGTWQLKLRTIGFIGKHGLGKTKEGDGKTPIGLYSFGIAFGMTQKIPTQLSYIKINPDLYWVDDSSSRYYNSLVNECKVGKEWRSAEHLIKNKIAYQYALEIQYNKEKIPEKGSAIFLHCSENKPTSGCIAIAKEQMYFLLTNLNKDAYIQISPFPER